MPATVIAELKEQRAAILHNASAAGRPLTWREERELFAWYSNKVDALLDAGSGACWLSNPTMADLVGRALCFFDGARYEMCAWVVMPNHVHAVLRPIDGNLLSGILHSWKSYTGNEANGLLRREGKRFWQKESYDHWIRSEEEYARLVAYVENNPVKAGLCAGTEEWRWSSASSAAAGFGLGGGKGWGECGIFLGGFRSGRGGRLEAALTGRLEARRYGAGAWFIGRVWVR